MTMYLVPQPDYRGEVGLNSLRRVQHEMTSALQREEWEEVRRLDRVCTLLIDRVVAANREDKAFLMRAMAEVKGLYAGLVAQCEREVTLLHAT